MLRTFGSPGDDGSPLLMVCAYRLLCRTAVDSDLGRAHANHASLSAYLSAHG